MRKVIVFLLLVSMLSLPVLGEEAAFITVVGANAPTSDVVTAANFAANMKLEADATFTGRTDEQIKALSTAELTEKTLVIIDDKRVEIIKGEDAPQGHNIVVQRAFSYFSTLGFEVEILLDENINPAFISVENEREEAPAERPPVPVVEKPEPSQEAEESEPVLKELGEACEDDSECTTGHCNLGHCVEEEVVKAEIVPEDEKPNVFVRVWQWFTGLFS